MDPRRDLPVDTRILKAAIDSLNMTGQLPTDDEHHYLERTVRHVFLDDDNSLFSVYDLCGRNVTSDYTTSFPLVIGGDSPADFEALRVEVQNKDSRATPWLATTHDVVYDNHYSKAMRIELERPLPPGAAFRYSVALTWPGTAATERDYVFANYGHYVRGVDRASVAVVLGAMPPMWRAGFIDQSAEFTALPDAVIEPDYDEAQLTWTIIEPDLDLVYVLLFRRPRVRHRG
jgi:hypothetical protein